MTDIFLHALRRISLRVYRHEEYLDLIRLTAKLLQCLIELRHGCWANIGAGGVTKEERNHLPACLAQLKRRVVGAGEFKFWRFRIGLRVSRATKAGRLLKEENAKCHSANQKEDYQAHQKCFSVHRIS
jgi:hypothetical protein